MEERKELKIKIEELPLRAKKLNPDELPAVFGGCNSQYNVCISLSDCCNQFGTCQFTTIHFFPAKW